MMEQFEHYSKESKIVIKNGISSKRETIVKIDTNDRGIISGTLTVNIKSSDDKKIHSETFPLSAKQISVIKNFKIPPSFDKLLPFSGSITRTKTKRNIKPIKNRRNLTRRAI
jgi:hypothetical protein